MRRTDSKQVSSSAFVPIASLPPVKALVQVSFQDTHQGAEPKAVNSRRMVLRKHRVVEWIRCRGVVESSYLSVLSRTRTPSQCFQVFHPGSLSSGFAVPSSSARTLPCLAGSMPDQSFVPLDLRDERCGI